jgi:serine/threonine protein kinase
MVATLADALHHSHQAGVIHRDIKPANVLLADDGTLKVTDFGLAKRLDEADGLTRTGAIMGSLGYMAPEQAAGRTREATPSTDVYSLGAVLYKLLSGRVPFDGPSQMETIISIVTREPVSIQVFQPRVPQDLATICHKCLENPPDGTPAPPPWPRTCAGIWPASRSKPVRWRRLSAPGGGHGAIRACPTCFWRA